MSDPGNPYSTPPDAAATPTTAAASAETLSLKQRLRRYSLSAVVLIVFFASGYIAFHQIQLRHYSIAFPSACLSLMCIPFTDHSSTIRERFLASLIMPAALAGLAGSVFLYFKMFQFTWFEAIFNTKGSGPVGLIVSAMLGLVGGGLLAWRFLRSFLPDYPDASPSRPE